jgi:hypothetical protein
MSNVNVNADAVKSEPHALEPDDERVKRQLVSAVRHFAEALSVSRSTFCIALPHYGAFIFLNGRPPDGMMPLDVGGYDYLRRLGFSRADVRRAVNTARRESLIRMLTRNGVSYVGLAEKAVLR